MLWRGSEISIRCDYQEAESIAVGEIGDQETGMNVGILWDFAVEAKR